MAARRRGLARLALLVAFLILVVVVVLVLETGGGNKGAAIGGTPRSTPSSRASSSAVSSALPTPTVAHPLRLKNYGDSMGGELGMALAAQVHNIPAVKYWTYYKVSSSLVKPSFFNWPSFLQQDLPHRYLQAVVFMVGTNDGQGMVVDGKVASFASASWRAEYERRVGQILDIFQKAGVRRVYWIGMPIMRSASFSSVMMAINAAAKTELARHKIARYIDTWTLFSTSSGAYDPQWRQSDGVHFNIQGEKRLATAVLNAIKADWHLR
jgi:hypothetical protein